MNIEWYRKQVDLYIQSWVDEMSSDAYEWAVAIQEILNDEEPSLGPCMVDGYVWCDTCDTQVSKELDLSNVVHTYSDHQFVASANSALLAMIKDRTTR